MRNIRFSLIANIILHVPIVFFYTLIVTTLAQNCSTCRIMFLKYEKSEPIVCTGKNNVIEFAYKNSRLPVLMNKF